jgi:hypothetical protein
VIASLFSPLQRRPKSPNRAETGLQIRSSRNTQRGFHTFVIRDHTDGQASRLKGTHTPTRHRHAGEGRQNLRLTETTALAAGQHDAKDSFSGATHPAKFGIGGQRIEEVNLPAEASSRR